MAGMFGPLGDLWEMAFKPFSMLGGPGLGAMGDMQGYNAHNMYNPTSISSLGKVGPYVGGAVDTLGNRLGGPQGGGQQGGNMDAMKQYYTSMMVNKLGQPR